MFLAYISIKDIFYRKIKNTDVLIVLVLSLLLCVTQQNTIHSYSFLMIATLTILLVAIHAFAAGDSKLATALSVAIPFSELSLAIWVTLVVGGILALFYWVKYRLYRRAARGQDPGIPYGVAISIGFYLSLLSSYL
ncbi:prepilin peptidase [Photobacterium aquae]|uniref:prepilin peptidase n=1 Tax=Photobacterium aquae TaxID=1195763 RepID=UPI00146FDA1E|nr:prepilin peptidase [Photobacterium aquae]